MFTWEPTPKLNSCIIPWPNQTVKNELYAKKIKLAQIRFFLEKQLIKFSCTYWPLSFCKILKKFLDLMQSFEDVASSGPKWPICPEQNFFDTNHCYYFYLPISPFHGAIFKKILTADPELRRCAIFGPKMVHLPLRNFFWKIITIILIYLLALFIVQNLKKNSSSGCAIFGPKMVYFANWQFFPKIC